MKKLTLCIGATIVASAFPLALVGCGGDDDVNPVPTKDASTEAAADAAPDTTTDAGPGDAGKDVAIDVVDASTPIPPQLLLSMNNASTSELLAMDLATKATNSLVYAGSLGTTFSRGADPYALEQKSDVVARLDPRQPWKVLSSWAVGLDDKTDGGAAYSDPLAIAVAGTKAYVARYTRNKLAVLDTTETVDAGAPKKSIDLSGFVQAADGDGTVEATFAFTVPTRHLLYVLLGNIDRGKVASDGFTLLCSSTTPLLVGIDTNTDQVTTLGGTGPSGSIVLGGYSPAFGAAGAAAVYDAAGDRLLVLHGGCNLPLVDGGTGAISKREVEEVALATGQVKMLLDLNAAGFPGGFAYAGPHDAMLGLGSEVRRWDPTQTTLGAAIPNAPDAYAFAYAGGGVIVGTRSNFADGGIDVVRTFVADGGTTTLASNPFKDNSGFIGGVEVWPAP